MGARDPSHSGRRLIRLGRTIGAVSLALLAVGIFLEVRAQDGRDLASIELRRLADPTAAPAAPSPPPTPVPTPRPARTSPVAAPSVPSPSGTGNLVVVPGSSEVSGPGPVRTFLVEVEEGVGIDGAAFASAVVSTLFDSRSWGGTGRVAFRRTDANASFRVALAGPETTRRLCRPYDTGRTLSCFSRNRAVLNAFSWQNGKPFFPDLATYRAYMVNHEVGHALGRNHRSCPGRGLPAPVMMQQSKGLDGCAANGWPLDSERD